MFLTMDEVIATAASTIKDVTTTDKLLWRQWIAIMCLPELGIAEDDVKIVTLYPVDFAAQKPDDMRALTELSLFDVNGCPLTHKLRAGGKRIYVDARVPRTAVVDTTGQQLANAVPVDISEDNFSFQLGTNGQNVAAIVVRYYAYPTDDDGMPLIRQEEAMAVVFFVRFWHEMRKNESRSAIEQNRQMWALEADRVRAKKKMYSLSPEKMKQVIKSTWMRGIPSFKFSQF
jgi:hypothetical protein